MKTCRGSFNTALLMAGLCSALWAQSPILHAVEILPDMEVTAPRPSLAQTINHTEALDQPALSALHYRSIADVLQGNPGFNAPKFGGYGQVNAPTLRGAGGQGLMLLDGIPILLALPGSSSLDSLPLEAIGSVEVQRGPAMAHQSFQALGGAIQLNTSDRPATGLGLSAEGGSFGLLRETLQGGLVGSAGRLTVTANHGDAFEGAHVAEASTNPEREPFHFTQGLMRFNTDLGSRLNWQSSLLYRQSSAGSDRFGPDAQGRVILVDDPQSYSKLATWLAQSTLNYQVSSSWKSHLQLGFTQQATDAKAGPLFNAVFSRLFLVNWRNEHTLLDDAAQRLQWRLLWGGQGRHEQGASPLIDFSQERTMASAFIETTAQYGRVSGDLGVRVEHYDYFGDHPLVRAATAWQVSPDLTLRLSGGTGYRIPSYAEMFFLYFGNPTLRPERSASGEVAFEWYPLQDLQVDLKGYYYDYTDLITIAVSPQFGPNTQNVNHAATAGMELSLKNTWSDDLEGGFSYTYNDSRDVANDKALPYRPEHNVKLWGQWRLPNQPIILRAEGFYGSGTWSDFDNTIPLQGSEQINVVARYLLSSNLELYIRGENLTDNRNAQIFSLDRPGVSVYGGLQLNL